MATIHKGFIDKRFYDSFKDTGLNDVDLATTKVYLGVHPMWKQLGFSQNSLFDNPASKYYWGNILPKKIAGKRVTFENIDGIEGKRVDAKPDLEKGKKILIVAHGNSLRALVKYIDKIGDKKILDLNIPTGAPLVYELKSNLNPIKSYYLDDEEEMKKKADEVAAQGSTK